MDDVLLFKDIVGGMYKKVGGRWIVA